MKKGWRTEIGFRIILNKNSCVISRKDLKRSIGLGQFLFWTTNNCNKWKHLRDAPTLIQKENNPNPYNKNNQVQATNRTIKQSQYKQEIQTSTTEPYGVQLISINNEYNFFN